MAILCVLRTTVHLRSLCMLYGGDTWPAHVEDLHCLMTSENIVISWMLEIALMAGKMDEKLGRNLGMVNVSNSFGYARNDYLCKPSLY